MPARRIKPHWRNDGTFVKGHVRRLPEVVKNGSLDKSFGVALRNLGAHTATPSVYMGVTNDGSVKDSGRQIKQGLVLDKPLQKNVDASGGDYTGRNFKISSWRKINFSGSQIQGASFSPIGRLIDCSFDDANMDFVNIYNSTVKRCSFKGASLRGIRAEYSSFKGCDFSDADLSDARFWGSDLRGCSWKGANMKDVALIENPSTGDRELDYRAARYEKYTFEQAAKRMGLDEETFKVVLWVEDIEVRHNDTYEVVTKDFNPEKNHIPEWVIQNSKPA